MLAGKADWSQGFGIGGRSPRKPGGGEAWVVVPGSGVAGPRKANAASESGIANRWKRSYLTTFMQRTLSEAIQQSASAGQAIESGICSEPGGQEAGIGGAAQQPARTSALIIPIKYLAGVKFIP